MQKERTFAIIKPDAVSKKHVGNIIDMIERNGFAIIRMQQVHLNQDQARSFYAIHQGKPFFDELVNFISAGPSVVMVLEKENAIKAWRDLMGATDPLKALEGTVRRLYGSSIGSNAVHGSDSAASATSEIGQFFPECC